MILNKLIQLIRIRGMRMPIGFFLSDMFSKYLLSVSKPEPFHIDVDSIDLVHYPT